MGLKFLMLIGFLLVGLGPRPGEAAALPQDVGGFTEALADRLRAALPDAKVTVDNPLTLIVDAPGKPGAGVHANLDRMWNFCRKNAEGCESAVDEFVRHMAVTLSATDPPPDAAALRVVVRPTIDLDEMLKGMSQDGKEPPKLIIGPAAGELSWMLVLDLPKAVKSLDEKELETLGLSREQAYERGLRNLSAEELSPFEQAAPMPPGGKVGVITGNYYDSSRMLLHDAWKPLADKMVGPLLVAVPGANLVLYGDGGWPDMQATLTIAAHRAALENQKPLSTQVLKWTTAGWEVVPP